LLLAVERELHRLEVVLLLLLLRGRRLQEHLEARVDRVAGGAVVVLVLVLVLLDVDRKRCATHARAALLDHREGRQEVADLLGADAEGDLLFVDPSLPLEVGDAVPVDHDAPEPEPALHVGPVHAAKRQTRADEERHHRHASEAHGCWTISEARRRTAHIAA
jgi:hypothetical protein